MKNFATSRLLAFCVVMFLSCGYERGVLVNRSPDGSCRIVASNRFDNPFSLDARLSIVLECDVRSIQIYKGKEDWNTASLHTVWSADKRTVSILACGRISSPVALAVDIKDGHKIEGSEALLPLRKRALANFKNRQPAGCPSVIDPALWPCCIP